MKKIIFPAIALTVLGLGLFTTQYVSAQDNQNPQTSLVQKLATKFGVNESDVQSVFDEASDEHRKVMDQELDQKLIQAVTDGKLTEEQRQLVLQKHEELQKDRESHMNDLKNKSSDETHEGMSSKRQELKDWADSNGIDMEYLMGGHGPKMFHNR